MHQNPNFHRQTWESRWQLYILATYQNLQKIEIAILTETKHEMLNP
jgi:hypothetical protein